MDLICHPSLSSPVHTHLSSRCGRVSQPLDILFKSSKFDGEKECWEREREREQEQNAFYCFKTFSIFSFVRMFSSSIVIVSNDYNTAFLSSCLLNCLLLSREITATEGEKRGREGIMERAADRVWYVSRVIGCVSSVCGLCCCQESEGRSMQGAVSRVKRLRVSPGSLCRSLVPAGHSCSFSSLSAGCTAKHWCLWQGGCEAKRVMSLIQSMKSHLFQKYMCDLFAPMVCETISKTIDWSQLCAENKNKNTEKTECCISTMGPPTLLC